MSGGYEFGPDVVKDRPNFGDKQVRNPHELRVGGLYIAHDFSGSTPIEFLGLKDLRWFRCRERWGEQEFESERALADVGVVPYNSGQWNRTNWLEKAD